LRETATPEQIKLFSDLVAHLKENLKGKELKVFTKAVRSDMERIERASGKIEFASQKEFFPSVSVQIEKHIASGFIDLNKFIS
jgi:hypothetical protein